ncbi:MAG: tryptophan 7-halogenase [Ardenticatenales bacterium]|nr:tryptophan 7-halogenase [Ardenticatenales bacterium]
MNTANQFDVAIMGAGIGGSLLATVLSDQGLRVLLLDAATHPRFVIGESTVRHTLRLVKIMAEHYDIEELRHVGSGENIRKYVTSACGEKRNFGFIYHRMGQQHNPAEANQLVIPPFREGYEAHLFRQDIDAYLYQAALHHGTVGMQNTRVSNVDIDGNGVTLTTDKGETLTASYLVDAAGFRSPLSDKFDLRDNPPQARTHSRAIFTHMIDVKDFDELSGNIHGQPEKWYSGTCHHIFDGGWMWIIPFDNHPESTNPLVSVGLQLDSRLYPKPADMTPQEEWDMWMKKLPSVGAQFKDAKIVRPWISTGRIQYTSKKTVGDRWCLLAQASGNIDALFSRGLANTMEAINALIPMILGAVKDNDFRAERFQYLEELQQNNIKHNDLLVWGAYVSFRDYELWNAWFRIWALGVGIGDLRLASIYRRYEKTHDDAILPEKEPPMGLFCSNHPGFKKVFDEGVRVMEQVEAGTLDTKAATKQIMSLIQNASFTSPAVGLADPTKRYINAGTFSSIIKSTVWALTSAPPEMKGMLLGAVRGARHNKETELAMAG